MTSHHFRVECFITVSVFCLVWLFREVNSTKKASVCCKPQCTVSQELNTLHLHLSRSVMPMLDWNRRRNLLNFSFILPNKLFGRLQTVYLRDGWRAELDAHEYLYPSTNMLAGTWKMRRQIRTLCTEADMRTNLSPLPHSHVGVNTL